MITKVSTKDMSHEEWLERRRKTIGGSDAGTILGLSRFSSPYALWAEKTGAAIPEDISDKESVRLGNDLEDYVAQRWMEKTGKKLRRENNFIYNSDFPFAHANIDRAVVGEPDAGFEAKTTTSFEILAQCREGKYPDSWYCQVLHYMMVTGAKRWYLGVLVFGHGFFDFVIERDDAEVAALASAEADFWEKVKSNTPPEFIGAEADTEAVSTIYPGGDNERMVELFGHGADLVCFQALTKQIKELQQQQEVYKLRICQAIGDNLGGYIGDKKVTWKAQERRTFQTEAFQKAYPNLDLTPFYKVSKSRIFKIK